MPVHRIRSWRKKGGEVSYWRIKTWQQKRFSNWSGSGVSKAIRYRAINASARELNFS